jgi:hypothetical protein
MAVSTDVGFMQCGLVVWDMSLMPGFWMVCFLSAFGCFPCQPYFKFSILHDFNNITIEILHGIMPSREYIVSYIKQFEQRREVQIHHQ